MSNPIASENKPELDDLHWALDTIVWMSGSSDFSPGGQAHHGWMKTRPRLDDILTKRNWTSPMPFEPTSDPSGKPVVLINGEKCCAACCKPIFQEVPSGKGAEQSALDAALLLHDKVVETTGYSSRNVIPILAAGLETYAASLRQQLSKLESALTEQTVKLLREGELRDEAQGKVSQLEAELKRLNCRGCYGPKCRPDLCKCDCHKESQ